MSDPDAMVNSRRTQSDQRNVFGVCRTIAMTVIAKPARSGVATEPVDEAAVAVP
jgi:hypothetical protein